MSLINSKAESCAGYNCRAMAFAQKIICLLVLLLVLTGCGEKVISIQSEPVGALVWLNGREVGRTPVLVHYIFDGNYDVRLERDGYEPIMTEKQTNENSVATNTWVFNLAPRNDDPELLLGRARALQHITEDN
jgi:hypothetical protein